jgi:predicted O-methyltransferase YrrM
MKSEMAPDEVEFLCTLLAEGPARGGHVEIGTAAGGTLCAMMGAFTPTACPPFVVVDPMTYFPDQLEVVQANLRGHGLDPSGVDFRVGTSDAVFARAEAEGERFDFILIDAAHKIRYVMQDLRWARLLNPGGLLCLHDYCEAHKGVMWPVDRFVRRNPQFIRERCVHRLLALRRESDAPVCITGWDQCWAAAWSLPLQWGASLGKRLGRKKQSP